MAQPDPQAPVCVPQGELTITTDMEDLSTALFYDTVPDTWVARAYPSMMGLAAWYADLLLRIRVRTVRGAARPRPQRGPPHQSLQERGPQSPPRPGGARWPGLCQSRAGRARFPSRRRPTMQAVPPTGRKRQLPAPERAVPTELRTRQQAGASPERPPSPQTLGHPSSALPHPSPHLKWSQPGSQA